jgi:hypothetical protein
VAGSDEVRSTRAPTAPPNLKTFINSSWVRNPVGTLRERAGDGILTATVKSGQSEGPGVSLFIWSRGMLKPSRAKEKQLAMTQCALAGWQADVRDKR